MVFFNLCFLFKKLFNSEILFSREKMEVTDLGCFFLLFVCLFSYREIDPMAETIQRKVLGNLDSFLASPGTCGTSVSSSVKWE